MQVSKSQQGGGSSVADEATKSAAKALEEQQRNGVALLEALQAAPERPDLPVKPHAARLPSGARGVSLAFLRAVRDYYAARGGLGQVMGDICKKGETSVCSLTRSTGLSLAESVVLAAEKGGIDASPLVGSATSFFSYRSAHASLLSFFYFFSRSDRCASSLAAGLAPSSRTCSRPSRGSCGGSRPSRTLSAATFGSI